MNYIYLHGFCSGANSLKGSYLRKKFTEIGLILHTPDLNGGDFEHLTFTKQLAIVEELANSLEGEITILGSSLGGYLSALFAENSLRVKRMVLVAPAFQFATRYAKKMDPLIIREWKESGYIEVFHRAYQENRRLHYTILEDAQKYDEIPLKRQIPTLIFHGLQDETVSYQLSVEHLESHRQTELILLNSDHAMIEEVKAIWRYTRTFLGI